MIQVRSLLVAALLTSTLMPAQAATRRAEAARALEMIIKAADEADLRLNPQVAIGRGDLRFAHDFGDYLSDAWHDKVEAALRERVKALERIDAKALEGSDRIAFEVFDYQSRFALKGYESGVTRLGQKIPLDHLFGLHLTFEQFSSGNGVAPFKTATDYENGLKRLGGFVSFLRRSQLHFRRGMASGHTLPRHIVEQIIAQLDASINTPLKDNPYLRPTTVFPTALDAPTRERLRREYREAITGKVTPALRALRKFLHDDYLPVARTNAPGLAGYPDGAKIYATALEAHTTTGMGADAIHTTGLAEVARIRARMLAAQEAIGFAGTQRQFFDYLKNDARFKYASKEAFLQSFRDVEKAAMPEIAKRFSAMPKAKLEIRAVPAEQESSAGGAYYQIGTADGSRPGVFYVNTSNLPSRTSPRATALYLHEAMPGHHMQGNIAQENAALPANLRYGYSTAYGEGWGLYAEWLGEEMGLYADPVQLMGRLDMEMYRAIRLVVDTGLHAKGWSREQAIQYFLDHSTLDRPAAEQEVDRYIVWPGQAVSYKIGEVFIRELRERAQQALGVRFDVRRFHHQVLDTGAIPLAVLEKKIVGWIARGGD
jgi:uncharacterized protein (DUF885 family)